ncbi:MAG TPA: hypothetical protein VFS00_18800, partial [Polyangiaceae bacterium]|nr:hypothetical protein [Polyangiaceae bacterium]
MLSEPRPEKKKRPRFALALCAALVTHAALLTVLPRDSGQRAPWHDDASPFEVDMIVEAPAPAPERPPPAAEAPPPAERQASAEVSAPSLAKAATVDKRPALAEGP